LKFEGLSLLMTVVPWVAALISFEQGFEKASNH
jgi:hypothetical protein